VLLSIGLVTDAELSHYWHERAAECQATWAVVAHGVH
jgi:hypothetical protein